MELNISNKIIGLLIFNFIYLFYIIIFLKIYSSENGFWEGKNIKKWCDVNNLYWISIYQEGQGATSLP